MQNHEEGRLGLERAEQDWAAVGYGWLAFDNFVLERWNWDAPASTDAEQWATLVQQYNALRPVERMPYHLASTPTTRLPPPTHPSLPTPAQSSRALAPFQTPNERLISRILSTRVPRVLWLRTCYDPSLAARYADLFGWVEPGIPEVNLIEPGGLLDNATLYDFENSAARGGDAFSLATLPPSQDDSARPAAPSTDEILRRVLLRFPELCDGIRDEDEEGYEVWEWDQNDPAHKRAVTFLYVVDSEAVRGGWVKVLWLDEHGRCVWDNKVKPDDLMDFTSAFSAQGMDVLDGWEERGAIMEW